MHYRLSQIRSFIFRTFSYLIVIGFLSCTPEYLKPILPGKIPLVKTVPNQNQVLANSKIQLKAICYTGEESLLEVGFLVSPISGIVENGQSVEKFIVSKSDLTLINEGEFLFDIEYNVGSALNITKYYRAFCKNSRGVGFGEELSFVNINGFPLVITTSASMITTSGATTGGNVISDSGSSVIARGVAYGTFQDPTTANDTTINGLGTGEFTSTLAGLTASTLYYIRAYAINSVGTTYGSQTSFTTDSLPGVSCSGTPTVTDIDGNIYNTVKIGLQCWTQSNLKVSKYSNGDIILTGLNNSAWQNTSSGAYAIYNNDLLNEGLYGKLYNHNAVTDSRGLCPTGWHVPSDAEWTELENYLVSYGVTGGGLKSTATQPTHGGWAFPNSGATNSSGFTALPGGIRANDGDFHYINGYGFWWSSSVLSGSNAWHRLLSNDDSYLYRNNFPRSHGFSVRCLLD